MYISVVCSMLKSGMYVFSYYCNIYSG